MKYRSHVTPPGPERPSVSRFVSAARILLVSAAVFVLPACGSGDREATFVKRGPSMTGTPDLLVGPKTSDERFGQSSSAAQGHGGHGAAHGGQGPQTTGSAADLLDYELPATWSEVAPTDMRALNFQIGGDPRAYCFLAQLSGDASMVLINANRWRNQLSLPALSQEELDALPRIPFFGQPCVRMHWEGDFDDGMSGEPLPDAGLHGLILQAKDTLLFLKMVGPKELIASEAENFDAFARSLVLKPAPNAAAHGRHKIAYEAPQDWNLQAPNEWRDLGFDLPGECDLSVSLLVGNGGGLALNVNRWRDQFGLEPSGMTDITQLPRVTVFGSEGYWMELAGPYRGMGSTVQFEAGALLGAIVPMDDHTAFIKLTGPAEGVAAQEANLREFMQTLELEGHE